MAGWTSEAWFCDSKAASDPYGSISCFLSKVEWSSDGSWVTDKSRDNDQLGHQSLTFPFWIVAILPPSSRSTRRCNPHWLADRSSIHRVQHQNFSGTRHTSCLEPPGSHEQLPKPSVKAASLQ